MADYLRQNHRFRARSAELLFVLLLFLSWQITKAAGEAYSTDPLTVVTLTDTDPYLPAFIATNQAIRKNLLENSSTPIEFFTEPLDFLRFPRTLYDNEAIALFKKKYESLDVDVVVAVGPVALEFAESHLASVWPGARIVYSGITETEIARRNLGSNTSGIPVRYEVGEIIEVAKSLMPDLRRIIVISGIDDYSILVRNSARVAIENARASLEVVEISGQPLDVVRDRVSSLDEGDAVINLTMFRDNEGGRYVPRDVVREVSAASPVPVFGIAETFLGTGVALVVAATYSDQGKGVAEIILDAMQPGRISPESINHAVEPTCLAEWEALVRWDIDVDRLPGECEILGKPVSLWEGHKGKILGLAGILLLQSVLIASLVAQRRRRSRAEMEVNRQRIELARSFRRRTAGELTASIAHEINQPLGAILNNAEAASLLLEHDAPDLDEIKEIIEDIRRDDIRASQVIVRLKALLSKGDSEKKLLNINTIVQDTLSILRLEAKRRGVRLETEFPGALPPVLGDPVQLQTVVLNLVMNALDAMEQVPEASRELMVSTSRVIDFGVEVVVSDQGPGFDESVTSRLFDSFYTTKTQGLGIGLSISRSVVEAHGGEIHGRCSPSGGAIFWFTLPEARRDETRAPDSGVVSQSVEAT